MLKRYPNTAIVKYLALFEKCCEPYQQFFDVIVNPDILMPAMYIIHSNSLHIKTDILTQEKWSIHCLSLHRLNA